ncbi:GH25 family lysozyme [Alicyclobacillus sp. SO9]|uniref:GH25 family lysozyme n=1 Tax=Alicyclobacillus sp. SO9 TaxID=2665646 RepID=UPI0018E846F7|nr:GH25 family lysozyme [Alicyclobacillus sp. SO9]QQE77678.1 peptidoglycan-binding protein [Alicyclobacillus sp. SO9]
MQGKNNDSAKGMDVSHWQGSIDWGQVKKSGIVFAFIKATESTNYTDVDITVNFEQSKAEGVLRGAYHFARPSASDAKAQVSHFVSVLLKQTDSGDLPPVLDLEDNGGLSPEDLGAWVDAWVEELEAQIHRTPLIYVSPYFANTYLPDKLVSTPLWIANWEVSSPADVKQWSDWTFWQYSNKGSVAGIKGPVDLDVYKGTVSALREVWGPGNSAKPGHSGGSGQSSSSPSASHPMLLYGDTGIHVKDVQILLYRAGLHPGWIDGIFGPDTLQAVRDFQHQQKISMDGIVGPVTWTHLLSQTAVGRPLLQHGSRGQQVTDLQYLLSYYGTQPGAIDGIFGPLTGAAVKRFQRNVHIGVDGIVGPNTWHSLTAKLPSEK